MVHYIRLLRTPQVSETTKKSLNVSAVVSVTTDLGDSFLAHPVTLIARIVDATNSGEILSSHDIQWQLDARALKVNISCSEKYRSRLVYVHITCRDTIARLSRSAIPDILDVRSTRFQLKNRQNSDPLVERRLHLNSKCKVRIWEETGDSIARHIWDASLGFLTIFQQCFSNPSSCFLPMLQRLLADSKSARLKVLEVGAGCGIAGIALAQMRKCDALLTDLEDAQEILQHNVTEAVPAAGVTIRSQVLAWGSSLDDLTDPMFDLVLVSDCIYNPDSSILLVQTLQQISKHNPNVQILVGFKRRHEADDVFLEQMKHTGFIVAEQSKLDLPHIMTEYDVTEPKVEMFVYTRPS